MGEVSIFAEWMSDKEMEWFPFGITADIII